MRGFLLYVQISYKNIMIFMLCVYLNMHLLISVPCPPAEEGQPYTVNFESKLKHTSKDKIVIESHEGRIATCTSGPESCKKRLRENYLSTIYIFNGKTLVNLSIYTISRKTLLNDESVYFRVTIGNSIEELICTPKIYYKAQNVTSKSSLSNEGLNISFETQKVLPKGKCKIQIYFNHTVINTNYTSETSEVLSSTPTYFKTRCSVVVAKSSLNPGRYNFTINMYPDVSNDSSDLRFGFNFTYSHHLDIPSVNLADCPQIIKEGALVKCLCKGTNLDGGIIYWLNVYKDVLNLDNSSLLVFQANKTYKENMHYCQGRNILNWTSFAIPYEPTFIDEIVLMNLTLNGASEDVFYVGQIENFSIKCDIKGLEISDLKLSNGPLELTQKNITSPTFSLEHKMKMTCESFNIFTCIAAGEHKNMTKTFEAFTNCAPRLTSKSSQPTIFSEVNSNISITIEIFSYPKPHFYSIIKHYSKRNFQVVTDGNAFGYGYTINYQVYSSPYGVVILTFNIIDERDFTKYLFIIDNGEKPTLDYSFNIAQARQSVIDSTHIIKLIGYTLAGFLLMFLIAICYRYRKKVRVNRVEHEIDVSFEVYEETLYEEIALNDVGNTDLLIQPNVPKLNFSRGHYNEIDDSLVAVEIHPMSHDSGEIVISNIYNQLRNETVEEFLQYTHIIKTPERNTEHINVKETFVLYENEYITVIDMLQENDYITVIDVLEDNEYITVIGELTMEENTCLIILDEPAQSINEDILLVNTRL